MILNEKIILITGGSGLLGREMIKNVRDKGGIPINLDINCDKNLDSGEWKCDITSDADIVESIQRVHDHFGRIDGLVNNAYPRTKDWGSSFERTTPDSWRMNVDWQMNSYFVITQQVISIMKEQGNGSVVNIASIYGVVGNDFTVYENTKMGAAAAYSAIKGGLINFSRYLASLFGPDGIRINCVSPGGIFDNQDPIFVKAYEKKVPMKRMGKPDDIAPVVSFLLSDEAKYITGQNLLVDGGWTAI
jgi:NAD(P)-dependent dehydrogenase (short-subunit alcohol dehydrogenase family)